MLIRGGGTVGRIAGQLRCWSCTPSMARSPPCCICRGSPICRPAGGILNGGERANGESASIAFSLRSALRRCSPPLQNNNKTVIGDDECVVKKQPRFNIGIPPSANEQTVNAFRIA